MALRQGHVQILVATDVAARGIDVPTITHVFNFGLPMKAEDYTHRIGRTGRAGRDGLAITFAEMRDRRKIFDIEAYTRQPIKAEVVPGLEPQQRMPESRPSAGFGGRNGGGDRDRKFSSGPREGGFGGNRGGFADRAPAGGNRDFGGNSRDFSGAAREGFSYERKGGFNDRFAGSRNDGPAPRGDFGARNEGGAPRGDFGAPRGDFGARKPAFGKPMGAKPGNGGKVFVPRDAKKWPAKTDR
jgi:superfamily II DNA/RNA helicase